MQEKQLPCTWPLASAPSVPRAEGGRAGLRGVLGKGRGVCA